jgi:hypothetical protein
VFGCLFVWTYFCFISFFCLLLLQPCLWI